MHGCVGGSGGWESLYQLFLNKAPVRDTQLNPARGHGKCTPRRTFRERVPTLRVSTLRVALPCDFRAPPTAIRSRQVQTRRDPGDGAARAAHCSLLSRHASPIMALWQDAFGGREVGNKATFSFKRAGRHPSPPRWVLTASFYSGLLSLSRLFCFPAASVAIARACGEDDGRGDK